MYVTECLHLVILHTLHFWHSHLYVNHPIPKWHSCSLSSSFLSLQNAIYNIYIYIYKLNVCTPNITASHDLMYVIVCSSLRVGQKDRQIADFPLIIHRPTQPHSHRQRQLPREERQKGKRREG